MKYPQACILKKQVGTSIQKLTTTVMGPGVTNVVRMRLAIVHVSCNVTQMSLMLNYHDNKIWRIWKVTWPSWHGTGTPMILMWIRMMADYGCLLLPKQ